MDLAKIKADVATSQELWAHLPVNVRPWVERCEALLAEVERLRSSWPDSWPDYLHEAKRIAPWLPDCEEADDAYRNRTRAENAAWIIGEARRRIAELEAIREPEDTAR